jgi:hypothetical protein
LNFPWFKKKEKKAETKTFTRNYSPQYGFEHAAGISDLKAKQYSILYSCSCGACASCYGGGGNDANNNALNRKVRDGTIGSIVLYRISSMGHCHSAFRTGSADASW